MQNIIVAYYEVKDFKRQRKKKLESQVTRKARYLEVWALIQIGKEFKGVYLRVQDIQIYFWKPTWISCG